jgi:lantibiotic modifying enzyme
VRRVLASLEMRAVKHNGDGARWNFTTDVISGTAGIGLFLLEAARTQDDPAALALAARAGKSLLGAAKKSPGGLDWSMAPFAPYVMPNFSHGTAGIAYFLATLYGETKRKEFLDAAVAGANHLLEIANKDEGVCVVYRYMAGDKVGGFLLGWCHGPPGTARLFERLALVTGDPSWRTWVLRGARSVVERGEKSKNLWDNSSLCCGTAGVGDFFLDLYRSTGDATWLEHARTLGKDIVSRGRRDASGLTWGAPSRTAHAGEKADTIGLMQGASGIGLFLLHLDAAEKKRELAVRLPDTPFR